MNKSLIFFGLITLIVLFSGCETITDFPKGVDQKRYLTVEATFTTSEAIQKVRVTYTSLLTDSFSSTPIRDANVSILSDDGETIPFTYDDNGWYISKPCAAKDGRRYTLEINTDSLDAIATSGIEPVRNIEKLYYKPLNTGNEPYTIFHVYANAGSVEPGNIKYYMYQMYVNDSLITTGSQIWAFNDRYLTNLDNLEMPYDVYSGDTVDIELLTLTAEMFNYYASISKEIAGGGLSDLYYKTNPSIMFNTFVLGYFQVSAVNRKRIVIQ